MAKTFANGAALTAKGDISALPTYNFLRSQNIRPFISDDYIEALKAPLNLGKGTKVVDFVAEGRSGLVFVEAKPAFDTASEASKYIKQAIRPGGKFVGTNKAMTKVYGKAGEGVVFPGIEKQIIASSDLSGVSKAARNSGYWGRPTGVRGEFQLFEGNNPVMPNGLPVFLQEIN